MINNQNLKTSSEGKAVQWEGEVNIKSWLEYDEENTVRHKQIGENHKPKTMSNNVQNCTFIYICLCGAL
jgi:hypothetical protein